VAHVRFASPLWCRFMPSHPAFRVELSPDERRRQVAAILAAGVIRLRRAADLVGVGQFSPSRDPRLEVVSETRLSVSVGPAIGLRGPECEVIDERVT